MCSISGYLKCKACRIKRYCGEECQQKDVQAGHMEVCGEMRKEETVERGLVDKMVVTVFQGGEGVTYNQFYDRIMKRMNQLVRVLMKRDLEPGDSYEKILENNEVVKRMVESMSLSPLPCEAVPDVRKFRQCVD